MIDIEKLRHGLEICLTADDCKGCPYCSKDFGPCKLDNDALELLNDYERLAALHVDLLDKVEALLKTLKEARECTE